MEQRVSRLEERMNKLEEKVEKQALEFAETRVYVKEIYKKLDELRDMISSKKDDRNSDRMAKIVERSIWAIVAIVGYFAGKGIGG